MLREAGHDKIGKSANSLMSQIGALAIGHLYGVADMDATRFVEAMRERKRGKK